MQGLLDPLTLPQASAGDTPPAQQPPLDGWCPIHACQMKLLSNDRGSGYSHNSHAAPFPALRKPFQKSPWYREEREP